MGIVTVGGATYAISSCIVIAISFLPLPRERAGLVLLCTFFPSPALRSTYPVRGEVKKRSVRKGASSVSAIKSHSKLMHVIQQIVDRLIVFQHSGHRRHLCTVEVLDAHHASEFSCRMYQSLMFTGAARWSTTPWPSLP
jgi:hypothetical protein